MNLNLEVFKNASKYRFLSCQIKMTETNIEKNILYKSYKKYTKVLSGTSFFYRIKNPKSHKTIYLKKTSDFY